MGLVLATLGFSFFQTETLIHLKRETLAAAAAAAESLFLFPTEIGARSRLTSLSGISWEALGSLLLGGSAERGG